MLREDQEIQFNGMFPFWDKKVQKWKWNLRWNPQGVVTLMLIPMETWHKDLSSVGVVENGEKTLVPAGLCNREVSDQPKFMTAL